MATSNTTIDQLNEAAQKTALETFAKFYLSRFFGDGLDVFSQLDEQGDLADINHYLLDNRTLTREELTIGLLTHRSGNLLDLLKQVNVTFNAQGAPETPWAKWYADQIEGLPQGL